MAEDTLVYVFSHGQFIQAVRSLFTEPELTAQEKMRRFWEKGTPPSHGKLVEFAWSMGSWQH